MTPPRLDHLHFPRFAMSSSTSVSPITAGSLSPFSVLLRSDHAKFPTHSSRNSRRAQRIRPLLSNPNCRRQFPRSRQPGPQRQDRPPQSSPRHGGCPHSAKGRAERHPRPSGHGHGPALGLLAPHYLSLYRETLGADVAWSEMERWAFYEKIASPRTTLMIATGEQRRFANLLLEIGVVKLTSESF
jgi:hypothetical protein